MATPEPIYVVLRDSILGYYYYPPSDGLSDTLLWIIARNFIDKAPPGRYSIPFNPVTMQREYRIATSTDFADFRTCPPPHLRDNVTNSQGEPARNPANQTERATG